MYVIATRTKIDGPTERNSSSIRGVTRGGQSDTSILSRSEERPVYRRKYRQTEQDR